MKYLFYDCYNNPNYCSSCHSDDEDGYSSLRHTNYEECYIEHCCGVTKEQAIGFAKDRLLMSKLEWTEEVFNISGRELVDLQKSVDSLIKLINE